MQVMNIALGGLFSSRINMNLREEHGYTYGAQLAVRRSAARRARSRSASGVRTDVTGAGRDRDLQGSARHGRASR